MYKVSVPVMSEFCVKDKEGTLREIEAFGAQRVMLAISPYRLDKGEHDKIMADLEENCRFFKSRGYEVCAWLWAFLFAEEFPFTPMMDSTGAALKQSACPFDEEFISFAADYLKRIARTGVDMIMYDDDFGFGYCRSNNINCLCDLHVARIREIVGEDISRNELVDHILKEPKNKYRDAFLKANGESLENFAARMRQAVDEVNPSIRLGYCACMNSWDVDGTDPQRMSKILAGNTRPFCRLTGAPYWVNHHFSARPKPWTPYLHDVIEFHRMESAWTRDGEIELFSEGDPYPRPRYNCPAAYVEGFDMALRAAGCMDGILKYGIDYYSNPDYEIGYRLFHQRNMPTYEWIHGHFDGKEPCGIRVYESMKKIADCVPYTAVNSGMDFLDSFFSRAARALSYNAIPTVYEGKGVAGIAFDENARHLPDDAFDNGLIIDISAAEILTSLGVDVGVRRIGEKLNIWGAREYFYKTNNNILSTVAFICEAELDENAKVLSVLKMVDKEYPVSYLYENADGQRFLVFTINSRDSKDAFKSYERNRQIAESVEWLSRGNRLPAHVNGHPALYMVCKRGENSLSVGLWNFFEDIAIEPVVDLAENYSNVTCWGGSARLDGKKVYLSDIPAYGFIGLELTK